MDDKFIESVKNNPIFNMSLASKELFHSNFWAWLFERDLEYAKIFFPSLRSLRKPVEREKNNFDIKIEGIDDEGEKVVYLIENKFKSIPNEEQLIKYQEECTDFSYGLITGIKEPNFKIDNWDFLSYQVICDRIADVAEIIENKDSFEKKLIIKYAETFKELSAKICDFNREETKTWKTNPSFSKVEKIKMDDVLKKLMASDFCSHMNNIINNGYKYKSVREYELVASSDFRDKCAVTDIGFRPKKKNDKKCYIGIQIQDKQYRFYVKLEPRLPDEKLDDLLDNFEKRGWFERDVNINKKFKGHDTSMRKSYCLYGINPNEKYTFMYQYYKIDNISFDELGKKIIKDIEDAANIIMDNGLYKQ